MFKYIIKRIASAILTLFIAASLLFTILQFIPGKVYEDKDYDPATQLAIKDKFDLDEPFYLRYFSFAGGIIGFDIDIEDGRIESIEYKVVPQFGNSWTENEAPVGDTLINKVPISIMLGFMALILGSIIGILFGILSAIYKNKPLDHIITALAVIGISLPSFVFASILMYRAGSGSTFPVIFDDSSFSAMLISLVLPAIALSVFVIATLTRYMRTELIDVLGSEHITSARAMGLDRGKLIRKHSIRNALIPVITVMGPLTLTVLGGSMVIERVFSIPGLGDQLIISVQDNDHPMILGLTFYYTAIYMIIILIIDILYGIIDPRVRLYGGDE